MEKILIIQTRPGIGDLCVFLPPIYTIAEYSKEFELHLLTKKRTCASEFLNNNKYIKKINYLPDASGLKLNKKILNFLKKEKYEKCFIMHYGIRYFFLSKLAGIKKIFYYGVFKKNENIVKKSQNILNKWIGKQCIDFDQIINLNNRVDQIQQITFGIGGSGKNKKWQILNFIKLAQKINEKKKSIFLLAGGPEEIEDANIIKEKLKKTDIKTISICEKKIKDTLVNLSQSKLYIGNDTGFMHLSGCLGVRSYGLFGDTPPNYASYNKNIFAITPNGSCNITHGSGMMNKMKVDYVFDQISNYID